MTETPRLLLNLIEDTPSPEAKFIRSARQSKTFKLSVATDSPHKIGVNRNNQSPSILLTGDETPSGQMISTNFTSKADVRTVKSRRFSIDPKTSDMIDAIVQERQSIFKTPVLKPRFDGFPKENGELEHLTKEQKTIGKVVAMKKMKGLEEQTKDKQFDAKLEIFENVKTFVDTRQLFHQSSDEHPDSRKSSGEETESHDSNHSNAFHTPSPRSAYLHVSKTTAKRSSFAGGTTGTPKNLGIQDSFSAAVRASEEPAEESDDKETESNESPTSKRDQEIQRLYEEFKKNAVEKFGPEILERAQKRLKDPKQVKKLQKKHKEDLVKMKELQAELEDFDFSKKLMNGLMDKKRGSVDMQKETFDTFDNHIKNELAEAEDEFINVKPSKPRGPRMSITTPVSPRNPAPKGLKATNADEAAQIQLLLKIQQHQQRSDDIIKVLRKKLYGLDNKSSVFSEGNTPKIGSQSARKSKYFGTVETLETEGDQITVPSMPLNRVPTLRASLLKSSLKLDFGSNNEFDTPKSVRTERSPGFLPAINTPKGKSKPSSPLTQQRKKIAGIRDNLDNLVTNKDLNQKIRYSIREMAQSYAVPEMVSTPESLRLPKPEKSTAKLATSLASQIYKDKCIQNFKL